MAYLGDSQELGDDFHVGDKLLVDLQCCFALLARHLEKLGCTQRHQQQQQQQSSQTTFILENYGFEVSHWRALNKPSKSKLMRMSQVFGVHLLTSERIGLIVTVPWRMVHLKKEDSGTP